ncbi:Cullin-domain-containing protein [Cytidiella melzeri]|nr:Cullin-domain-containing protein [Cytidiella melzeri]
MNTPEARRGKTKIKPPKKHGPNISIDDTWAKLRHNMLEIQNHRAYNLSYEENHRYAYNMVLYKHGETLYKGTLQLIAENLDKLAKQDIMPCFPNATGEDTVQKSQEAEMLLKAVKKVWDDHTSSLSRLRDVLKYMDRVYTKGANVPEIWDAGLLLFIKHIIRPPIQQHLIDAILLQIHTERDGYVINRSAVLGCVNVLLQLSEPGGPTIYKRDLEPAILRESEIFYQSEGETLLQSCDAPEYLRRVESRLDAEQARTHHYLSSHTSQPLRQILERNMLTSHLSTIIDLPNSGLDAMIDGDKYEDLLRIYRLFVMVPTGLPILRKALKNSLIRRGKELNAASENLDGLADTLEEADDPKGKCKAKAKPNAAAQTLQLALKWVVDVLSLKDKFDTVWTKTCHSDREIESGINEAFETFINVHAKSPEFISLFIDDNLKKGLKGKTEAEVDAILDKTITVFRYITDKDVFERYYKTHLAKRLLQGRSVSDDAERGMLAKLKVECGFQFTQKLEGMFHDMRLSADTMQAYCEYISKHETQSDVEMSVTVMTSTFWPMSYSSPPCVFPGVLDEACKLFEKFYFSRHSGRKLTWQPSLGNADVRATFKARTHELNVSTFALVILLLFENVPVGETLSYEHIKSETRIQESELQRNLQSLACAKFKILRKHPAGRDVNPSDTFSFNADFTSPLQKIKISTIASRVESVDERKETQDRVDEERKLQTEACIVRIMKDRKHMTHNDLVNEVTRQLSARFHPQPNTIKKRIEGLIERDYLERCEDRKSYNYLVRPRQFCHI